MDRPSYRSGKGKSAQGADEAKDPKYIKRVDLWKLLAKWSLGSYPDARGSPLLLGSGKASVPKALLPEPLRGMLDADCSELLRRPATGLNLAAAAVDGAALFAALIPKLTAEDFLDKVQYLNPARDVERHVEEAPQQCKGFLKKIRRLVREHVAKTSPRRPKRPPACTWG